MKQERQSIDECRRLAENEPERLAHLFLSKYELLAVESQRAFMACLPTPEGLIENIKNGCRREGAPLQGTPYLLQDLFDVSEYPTRCGAPFADPFEAELEDSCLLAQTLALKGGAFFGKTVPTEFGVDARGHNKTFGDCPHAAGLRYLCGGGSGSSAYAVAGGWVPLAFGLDSRGGIRLPAAFHGLFGFRMENNDYARDGVFPIVPSIESVGGLTANLKDLQTVFAAFYKDNGDRPDSTPRGYLWHDGSHTMLAEVKAAMMQLLRPLDIDDEPSYNKMLSTSFAGATQAMTTIENRELYSIHQYWIEEYRSYYEPELLHKIEAGRSCSGAQCDEANLVQQSIRATIISFFRDYDYLVIPISPLASPERSEWDDSLEEELQQLNAPLSLSLLPALILPFRCSNGRHSAVQILYNPRKPGLVQALLEQLAGYYDNTDS